MGRLNPQVEQNDADQIVSTSWVFCEPAAVAYGLIATENTIFACGCSPVSECCDNDRNL